MKSLEYFPLGDRERSFTEKEKEDIIHLIKNLKNSNEKILILTTKADKEKEFYDSSWKVVSPMSFAFYFFMPVVKQRNIVLRTCISLLPAYMIYRWTTKFGRE